MAGRVFHIESRFSKVAMGRPLIPVCGRDSISAIYIIPEDVFFTPLVEQRFEKATGRMVARWNG